MGFFDVPFACNFTYHPNGREAGPVPADPAPAAPYPAAFQPVLLPRAAPASPTVFEDI